MAKVSNRLAWLIAALGSQHAKLVRLLHRLRGLGAPGAMKPAIFRKFLGMLDQVSVVKERENEIISRIQAIEAKHRFQRKHKALKHASLQPTYGKDQSLELDCESEYQRSSKLWLWLLVLWAWSRMQRPKIRCKKQDLTAD